MSMNSFAQRAAALALLTLITSGVQAQPVMKDGVLTDAAGRTLYTFDKDQTNKSNCAGGCLQAWPAYVAEASADAKLIQGLSRFDQNGVQQWSSIQAGCRHRIESVERGRIGRHIGLFDL